MKQLIITLLVCAAALPALANQRIYGDCAQGGYNVNTAGVVSSLAVGGAANGVGTVEASFPSCTVTVYDTGTQNKTTIYSDNSNTPKSNPFTAASDGSWFFYAANSRVDVVLSGANFPSNKTLSDILLNDSSGSLNTNNVWTGTNTFNNTVTFNASIGDVTATSYNKTCETVTGADISLNIGTAQTNCVPSTGGTIRNDSLLGTQTATTNLTLGSTTKPVTMFIPPGAQWSGAAQFTIAGHNTGFTCDTSTTRFDFDQKMTPLLTFTSASGDNITVSPNMRGAFIRNCPFRGANSGTAEGLFATGNSSGNTAITSLDLNGSNFDEFYNGIHLDQSVYGFAWRNVSASRNLNYGLDITSSNSHTGDVVNQASCDGCSFSGNKVQEHIEVPNNGTVTFNQRGGTIADTLAGTPAANGVEAVGTGACSAGGGTFCTARLFFDGVHFENLGGSSDGGTPDTTNAPLYCNVAGCAIFVQRSEFFIGSVAHPHNAIVLGSNATTPSLVIGPGNSFSGGWPFLLDVSAPTIGASGYIQVFDKAVTPALVNVGANGARFIWQNGSYWRDDGTTFHITNATGTDEATIANATGAAVFNGGVTPGVAGGADAGTTALPFGSLWIGGAATNNAQITGTFTAARVFTLPDTGSDTFTLNSAGETLTNKTIDTAAPNTLKINGTQVSAVTGSGSVVLATSPTLTTPTIGAATYSTLTSANNCSSSASPAVCGSAAAGSFVVAASATSVTVNTTAVTANSQIFIQPDDSLGTKLSVTCNTTGALLSAEPWVSARVAATSFTVTLNAAPSVNPECFSFFIVN